MRHFDKRILIGNVLNNVAYQLTIYQVVTIANQDCQWLGFKQLVCTRLVNMEQHVLAATPL